jgi:hypothetical protein
MPSILARKGWSDIDVLKIDIEGYEEILFAGSPAWLGAVRLIVGELHGSYGEAQLTRDLAPFGFSITARKIGTNATFIARRES